MIEEATGDPIPCGLIGGTIFMVLVVCWAAKLIRDSVRHCREIDAAKRRDLGEQGYLEHEDRMRRWREEGRL